MSHIAMIPREQTWKKRETENKCYDIYNIWLSLIFLTKEIRDEIRKGALDNVPPKNDKANPFDLVDKNKTH